VLGLATVRTMSIRGQPGGTALFIIRYYSL
jgi:hypothetical protein